MKPGEIPVGIDLPSLQKSDECLQRVPVLEEMVKSQDETIATLRTAIDAKEEELKQVRERLALKEKENEIERKMQDLYKKEAEIYKNAHEREKDLTDRALKLAEISKPQSNWQFQGLALLAATLFGYAFGKK